MVSRVVLLLVLATLIACNKKVKKADVIDNPEGKEGVSQDIKGEQLAGTFETLEMIKSRCRGFCPEYEIRIEGNGNARLIGKRNIELIGIFKNHFDKAELSVLDSWVQACDFYNLNEEYSKNIMDIPNTYVTCSKKEMTKRITVQTGAPAKLDSLISAVHGLVLRSDWEKVSDNPDANKIKGGLKNN